MSRNIRNRSSSLAEGLSRRSGLLLTALLLLLSGLAANSQSDNADRVDLALVIALDISASVDPDEFELMRTGLANALSSSQIWQAIQTGKHGAIAISIVQWSGFQEQTVKIRWTLVRSRAELLSLADKVRDMTRRYKGGATHIGGAIKFCTQLILSQSFQTPRKVIDVAGDGTNNVNRAPDIARDQAVEAGITINALAIEGSGDGLVDYFFRHVIGGPSAFVEQAGDYPGFERAMHRKLLREILPPIS